MRRTASPSANPTKARRNSSPTSPKPGRRDTVGSRPALLPLSGLFLVLVLVVQLLVAPHLPHDILRFFTPQHRHATSPAARLHEPALYRTPSTCPKPSQKVEFAGTFNTDTERSMALAEQAKRVAAEFDFGPDAVNKAVKEFIREMGTLRTCCNAIGD
jgi:hexokinase